MNQTLAYSSKEILDELYNKKENGNFIIKLAIEFESDKEIEVVMEQFDIEKKQRAAKAINDLSKLVITA